MMPPGRKRRSSDEGPGLSGSLGAPKTNRPRVDRSPADFSTVIKNKLQSYTRTGQACDRCKVRKIRCDALPEGCSHCTSQNLGCYVTDRVTGRTEQRGYLEQLERRNTSMLNHIRDLEKLVRSAGIEVHPWEWAVDGPSAPPLFDNMGLVIHNAKDQWTKVGSVWVKNYQPKTSQFPRPAVRSDSPSVPFNVIPTSQLYASTTQTVGLLSRYARSSLLQVRPTEDYLGVLTDSAPLSSSSIKGTKLSILGTTIDITSFDAPDMDEPPPGTPVGPPVYNKSLMAFLQSTFGVIPKPENVELPSRQQAFDYSEWYFLTVHPFMPVLHKPSFLNLLTRIYDEPSFKATTCELVTAHMVFATIYFQYGIRNREEPEKQSHLNELSNMHYHWSLSKFFDLASGNTVTAVQALAMIAIHTRSFPKPGCSSVIANYALSRAIELNLHRGVKIPDGDTNIVNEVRKRVWWATLALAVTLNGRLGRPMPITLEEFDVDLPVAIADEHITDEGITDPSLIGQCDTLIGLFGFKVVPLYMEMFSNIYCVRRDPTRYIDVVRGLEEAMRAVQENLPDELKLDRCKQNNRVFALYAQAICLEFFLCLRHPSVCMTADRDFCAENTRICEETAKQLLNVLDSLCKVKSLDTTWYQLSVYVAAIFSTLVAHWERRFDTTPGEIAALKGDMKRWMDIVHEIGVTLGAGAKVSDEIGAVIDRTITMIEHDMERKGTNQQHQQAGSPKSAPHQQRLVSHLQPLLPPDEPGSTSQQMTSDEYNTKGEHRHSVENSNDYYNAGVANSAVSTYPPHLAYPSISAISSHGSSGQDMQAGGSYVPADSSQYLYAPPTNTSIVHHSSSSENPLVAFASQAARVSVRQPGGDADTWRQPQAIAAAAAAAHDQSHNTGWQNWTAAMADSQNDRYSANALLTLGAGRVSDGHPAGGMGDGAGVSLSSDMGLVGPSGSATHPGQWPLLLFHEPHEPDSGTDGH